MTKRVVASSLAATLTTIGTLRGSGRGLGGGVRSRAYRETDGTFSNHGATPCCLLRERMLVHTSQRMPVFRTRTVCVCDV